MSNEFQVMGRNAAALFTLKAHRGEGMVLLAMNWKVGEPPDDFVGFAIEYKEPDGTVFFPLMNRLRFRDANGKVEEGRASTLVAPIQKFRWVHFPRRADMDGLFLYRVTPLFMNDEDQLLQGDTQEVAIRLHRETYPDVLNVTFTRGFVSSQAFVERYEKEGKISTLLPPKAAKGLTFTPTHPKADEALAWMGFEARAAILGLLDEAIADTEAKVRVVAYDLSEKHFVEKLKKLGKRLEIIIDDSGEHAEHESGESQAAAILQASAGATRVQRQHAKGLQHNKLIIVDGPKVKAVVYGSTNFSWRGFYVQANNAVIVRGKEALAPALAVFAEYWKDDPNAFAETALADWQDMGAAGIEARVTFSPHSKDNAKLEEIAAVIQGTKSSLFFSLAFLYQTKGAIRDAIEEVTAKDDRFVYGISDKKVGGLDLLRPNGNIAPVFAAALAKNVPLPFSAEPTGGMGTRMHHKFVVIDFDRPSARVYLGSYNFSNAADRKNGENLVEIRDRRVAVAYMVEAIRLFDTYHFRVAQADADRAREELALAKPPRKASETAWWREYYDNPRKAHDRELFA